MRPWTAKAQLIISPTPMHQLIRLTDQLGIDLLIKRDDLTGFAFGGNKGRKLELILGEIVSKERSFPSSYYPQPAVVVSCGAAQSNFIRQLGAACSVYGLKCVAAAMALPFDLGAARPTHESKAKGGNVVLDQILGVDLRMFPDDDWEVLYAHAEQIAQELEAEGKRVYRIPVGGSSPLGAMAFFEAAQEVGNDFDWIIHATSSGATQTGLATAFAGTKTKVLGIACDPEPEIAQDFAAISRGLAPMLDRKPLEAKDFLINFDYVGPGYGVPSEAGTAAIEFLARKEGIFLDPIYTGKAFAGLLDLAQQGELKGKVLFWHTGGVPALFAR